MIRVSRTPLETLEKFAEVAPTDWGAIYYYNKTINRLAVNTSAGTTYYGYADGIFSDTDNGEFVAWCKRQLRDLGYMYRVLDNGETFEVAIQGHGIEFATGNGDDDNTVEFESPTEWQGIVECLIFVLEAKQTTKNKLAPFEFGGIVWLSKEDAYNIAKEAFFEGWEACECDDGRTPLTLENWWNQSQIKKRLDNG